MKPSSLRIVKGEDKVKAWTPEDGWAKHFCGDCGSALFGGRTEDEFRIVRMGVLDGDPGIRPIARQFVANAAPWEPIPDDGLDRFEESMPVPGDQTFLKRYRGEPWARSCNDAFVVEASFRDDRWRFDAAAASDPKPKDGRCCPRPPGPTPSKTTEGPSPRSRYANS